MFITMASIRDRETREGDTDDDILLRLASKLLFHPRTVNEMCSNPSLESVATSSVDHHCHQVGWIDALCKAYRDIPSSVVNVLKKSHLMHTMVQLVVFVQAWA